MPALRQTLVQLLGRLRYQATHRGKKNQHTCLVSSLLVLACTWRSMLAILKVLMNRLCEEQPNDDVSTCVDDTWCFE